MKKLVFQGLLTITLFFTILFVLNQIDWMRILKAEQVSQTVDKKLGELYWELFSESEEEIENISITSAIDSILTEICNSNYIDKNKIKLHILENNEINAFALPDGHIVIYSGLILASESEAEFCGVLCHEIAHIELNHVMKKLIKEVGLSTLLSMTTGSNGVEILNESAKLLSSNAYDRKLEREADAEAVNFLIKSKIDPESFATFLFRLKNNSKEGNIMELAWINTHPNIEERVNNIIKQRDSFAASNKPILSNETWMNIKVLLENDH
ncbi:MAG: M48 family metalloprotease [Bacteroidales bacterium]|nr:M48 family metalloprotease [Bacteroidales bacterium]